MMWRVRQPLSFSSDGSGCPRCFFLLERFEGRPSLLVSALLRGCYLCRVIAVLLPYCCRIVAVIDSERTLDTIGDSFCEKCKKKQEGLLFSKKSRNFTADLVGDCSRALSPTPKN